MFPIIHDIDKHLYVSFSLRCQDLCSKTSKPPPTLKPPNILAPGSSGNYILSAYYRTAPQLPYCNLQAWNNEA